MYFKNKNALNCSVAQSCLTLCDTMDCNPPGSCVRGILQAKILEWVSISYYRGSSQPSDWTCISCVSCIGRRIRYLWLRPHGKSIFWVDSCLIWLIYFNDERIWTPWGTLGFPVHRGRTLWRHRGKVATYEPSTEALEETKPSNTLLLNFSFQNREKRNFCYLRCLVCGILLWQS